MDKFEKLKAIIEKEYKKKQSDLEKYYLEHGEKGVTDYRKVG